MPRLRDVMLMTAERKKVCVSNPKEPHGVGHNAVCVCECRWCVSERAKEERNRPGCKRTDSCECGWCLHDRRLLLHHDSEEYIILTIRLFACEQAPPGGRCWSCWTCDVRNAWERELADRYPQLTLAVA
jgi:hypothetical protein